MEAYIKALGMCWSRASAVRAGIHFTFLLFYLGYASNTCLGSDGVPYLLR